MPKKKTSSKTCLACGARLQRADAKYAKQYCDEHKKMMDQLRQMRHLLILTVDQLPFGL